MALARRTEQVDKSGDIVYTNLDAGEHEGRLVMVADLGLQRKEYKGEFKGNVQQIALGIEILGETITVDDKEVPRLMWTRPFFIYNTLTAKGIELVMYKIFDTTANEGELPDWDAQLGKPCTAVVENKQVEDKTYDNITDLLAIPTKYQDGVAEGVMETGVGDCEDSDNMVTKSLFGLAKFVYDKRVVEGTDTTDDSPY